MRRPVTNGRHVALGLTLKNGSFAFARIDSTTGATILTSGPVIRVWGHPVGGDWFFVGLEANLASGGTTPRGQLWLSQFGAHVYTGDGVSGCFFWHAFLARFDPYEHVFAVVNGVFATDSWPIANGPFVLWLRAYALNAHKQRTGTPQQVTLFVAPGTGGLNATRLSPETLGPGLQNTGADVRVRTGNGLTFSGSDLVAKLGAGLAFSGSDIRVGVAALVNAMLADGAVTGPKILANSIGAIHAVFQAAAIQNADISSLNVDKLTGATIAGKEFQLISSPNLMEITGAGGFRQVNSSSLRGVQIANGSIAGYYDDVECWELNQGFGAYAEMALSFDGRLMALLSSLFGYGELILYTGAVSGPRRGVWMAADSSSSGGVGDSNTGMVAVFDGVNPKVEMAVVSGGGMLYVDGQRVLRGRQTDPGASPTTEQLRQVLLAHGLI